MAIIAQTSSTLFFFFSFYRQLWIIRSMFLKLNPKQGKIGLMLSPVAILQWFLEFSSNISVGKVFKWSCSQTMLPAFSHFQHDLQNHLCIFSPLFVIFPIFQSLFLVKKSQPLSWKLNLTTCMFACFEQLVLIKRFISIWRSGMVTIIVTRILCVCCV